MKSRTVKKTVCTIALVALAVLFFAGRQLFGVAVQYAITFGLGYAIADVLLRELGFWEKLLIGAFLGPAVLGLAVLYLNIYLGMAISAANSLLLAVLIAAVYCFYRFGPKSILRRLRMLPKGSGK